MTACRLLPFVLLLAIVASSGTARADERLGWHGERMPEGLRKSEIEGRYLWSRDGSEMVYVPAGAFVMGSADEGIEAVADGDGFEIQRDERPRHSVWLSGFYLDVHETSWEQWKRSGMPWSDRIGDRRVRPAAPDWGIVDDHPVLDVTWQAAREYLDTVGKRLPTEAEWEKAARGTDGRRFPWGDGLPEPDVHAVWKETPIAQESTAPVTCCAAGASPYGVLNLAGNVYEWVLDVYDPRFYARSPTRDPACIEPLCDEGGEEGQDDGTAGDVRRVLRGGAYVLEIEDLRAALRWRLPARDRAPYIGFRGALSGVDAGPFNAPSEAP
ncbi:MAG: formylglycine-generating enzyme family protein [Acidobacteriota bacterium]